MLMVNWLKNRKRLVGDNDNKSLYLQALEHTHIHTHKLTIVRANLIAPTKNTNIAKTT